MKYIDISRQNHIAFANLLNQQFNSASAKMIPFGNHTQHLFEGNKYIMTINWSLL